MIVVSQNMIGDGRTESARRVASCIRLLFSEIAVKAFIAI